MEDRCLICCLRLPLAWELVITAVSGEQEKALNSTHLYPLSAERQTNVAIFTTTQENTYAFKHFSRMQTSITSL